MPWLWAWILGCDEPPELDRDLDGVGVAYDCDDTDEEVGRARSWIADADGDGYVEPSRRFTACEEPPGVVLDDGTCVRNGNSYERCARDCDDADPTVHPGADEVCDGLDQDCDYVADDGLPQNAWGVDADGDGFGSDTNT